MKLLAVFLAVITLAFYFSPALARHHHHHHYYRHHYRHAAYGPSFGGGEIIAHPEGCPRTEFCGCGAALRIFGAPIRALWLAANWFHFPRALPAPGMAAVRQHHVFVLEQHIAGDIWMAYDANSGHHLTRIHPRSIAGYTIVNPHGG